MNEEPRRVNFTRKVSPPEGVASVKRIIPSTKRQLQERQRERVKAAKQGFRIEVGEEVVSLSLDLRES